METLRWRGSHLVALQILDEETPRVEAGDRLDALATLCAEVAPDEETPCVARVIRLAEHYDDDEYGRAKTLHEAVLGLGAAVLVIGTHEMVADRKELASTMTHKLLQRAPCPVFIADTDRSHDHEEVCIAVDFSRGSVALAKEAIAAFPGSRFHVLTATDGDQKSYEEDRDLFLHALSREVNGFASMDVKAKRLTGDPAGALGLAAQAVGAGVLAVKASQKGGLTKFLFGSVATRLVDDPPCDLLLVRGGRS